MNEIIRSLRPIIIFDKKKNKKIYLLRTEIQEIEGKRFKFTAPNSVSIALNISNKEYNKAVLLFDEILRSKISSNDTKFIFLPEEQEKLYDYFEHLQTSIIFMYTAIEAFINYSIPETYCYEKLNNKKVKETWDKHAIQRWISTSEKLTKILPDILQVKDPTNEKYWEKYLILEEIRNDIIHQKTIKNTANISTSYLRYFFSLYIFDAIRSGVLLINYFCTSTQKEMPHIPEGIGKSEFEPIILDDINEIFTPIYKGDEFNF